MTIRKRLTFWYAAVMFISLLVMGVLTYHEFAPDPTPKGTPADNGGEGDEADLKEVLRIIFWCGVPSALIALGGGWWLMRRALAPMSELTGAMEKIHDKNLGEKIPRSGNGDELDRLTEVFNAMAGRLDDSFQRIREFTLHASHELKTPLTIIHGEIETELGTKNLSAEQRERLTSRLDEVQRLTKIVDGLTLLTKADAGQIALRLETVALDEIVRDAYADAQILGKPANLSVRLAACQEIKTHGDKHRLRQLLLNLADNAVKYNQPGGSIEFSLQHQGPDAVLNISNTGKNISPEKLPRIFERFFRGDPAHNSAVDGCGLGLSIAQWIVSAHNGQISVVSEKNLTTVTVRLPGASGEKT